MVNILIKRKENCVCVKFFFFYTKTSVGFIGVDDIKMGGRFVC